MSVRALTYVLLAALAWLASGAGTPTRAETGTVRIQVAKAGFIVGIGGGSGTLVFKGRQYPLSVGGLSLGATIGASKADFVGRAYNLHRASDIAGTYSAVGGSVAAAGGASAIRLQNAKGVVLEMQGRNIGLEFNVNVSGVTIALR